MRQGRVADSLLALLAVVAVIAPIRPLFSPDSWIPGAVVMALSVTVTGIVMRAATRKDVPVVATQIGVGLLLAGWLFGRGHLWYGLPTWQTVIAFNNILVQARETITSYAPPAPSGRGVILAMALIVWVTMLLVDALAVTRGSPALAGIPLLTAFLIAASNSGAGMPVGYFVLAAALWLLLLSRSGLLSLTRWDHGGARGITRGGGSPAARRLAPTARLIGGSAVVTAVLVAALLPHMPTRFLLDGLGRSDDATGSTGTMTLNSTVNLARSLGSQSNAPVLTYRTTAASAEPLRVTILDLYQGGEWREREILGIPRGDSLVPGPTDPAAETETIEVSANNLAAPQLALPYPATSLTIDSSWQTRADGTVLVQRRVDAYSAEYTERAPTEDALQSAPAAGPDVGSLDTDARSADVVADVLAGIITPGMSAIDKARAIQDHLRGPDYTYSLVLAGPAVNDAGNLVQLDPLSHFLLTKQGYCTQFATAMVMMARTEGIPARFAIGFLPGTSARGGERTVVAANAHAWPELYFAGVGWLRFEPTPAEQSGAAPRYTSSSWGDTDGSTATSTASATAADAPSVDRPADNLRDDTLDLAGEVETPSTLGGILGRLGWLLLALLVGALGAATMPLSAWWERRRRRREAADDAARVEVVWQDLLERLDDVGVTPPPDASPRQAGSYIWGATFLTKESRVALGRVVAAVEQARYARPGSDPDPGRLVTLEHDARTVSTNVVSSLHRSERLRARWWPGAGLRVWQRLGESLASRRPWRSD